ncbi:MAG: metallophosphoesterase family protein [Phycisphaeraceae bacterium]
MRIAVIGDIHLYRLKVPARRLIGKRLLGQSNLWFNRRFRFNHDMLEEVVERAAALEPDMVLLTGDVTSTSLEDEFADIAHSLKPLSEKFPTVLVPGNHDRYTFRSARKKRIEGLLKSMLPQRFPHTQALVGRWHLLALDSARPQYMLSRGALGEAQLAEAETFLHGLSADDGVVILCHYPPDTPPGMPTSWAHDLADNQQLREVLSGTRARVLFMHGHVHRPWHWEQSNGHGRRMSCLNAGAPCMTSALYPSGQGFWQVELPHDPHDEVTLIHHVPAPEGHYGTRLPRRHAQRSVEDTWQARRVT